MADLRTHIQTLAGVYSLYGDGNLNRTRTITETPQIVVFGSAPKGRDLFPMNFNVTNMDKSVIIFGKTGNLIAQLQEAQSMGVNSVLACRINARPAFAMHIGGTGAAPAGSLESNGYFVQLTPGGAKYATDFGIVYQTSDFRLIVEDKESQVVIFDNNPSAPIDLGLVQVSGTPVSAAGSNIGVVSPLDSVSIASLVNPTHGSAILKYNGDDGLSVGRMRNYEGMFQGLQALDGFQYNYVAAPPDATLDAPYDGAVAGAPTGGTAYPSKGAIASTAPDKLGKVYIEYVDDKYEFYWDVDGDHAAEYWSVTGTQAYSGTSKGGKVFVDGDFLEPNFAYTLAYDCHRKTIESHFCEGIIGIEPPPLGKSLQYWLGSKPTYSTDANGEVIVSADGSRLLGHKYVGGATTYRSAAAYGGFIETDAPYFDSGTELLDTNDLPVDLGKYLTLWATPQTFIPRLGVNNNQSYIRISPVAYAAFVSQLDLRTTPTHATYPVIGGVLTSSLSRSQLADLKEMRYTLARQTGNGTKVLDGVTAALPSSDFVRQGSIKLIRFVDNMLRAASDPYLGRYISPEEEMAFTETLNEVINGAIQNRILVRGSSIVMNRTVEERVRGEANVHVDLFLPFELNKITFVSNMRQVA
jgi:hypothetical protein